MLSCEEEVELRLVWSSVRDAAMAFLMDWEEGEEEEDEEEEWRVGWCEVLDFLLAVEEDEEEEAA